MWFWNEIPWKAEDIDYFVFSQLSDDYNMKTLEILGVGEDKYHFVGKEYGYTGNTCPILCLNRMWDTYANKGNKNYILYHWCLFCHHCAVI